MNNHHLGRLAYQFVRKTLQIDSDSRVWIDYQGEASKPLADACINACRNIGVVDAPIKEFAQSCGMCQREADKFFLNACLADYQSMEWQAELNR